MTRPSIDHSLLSPSGRMSKRARQAAMKRECARLFPPGYWEREPVKLDECARDLNQALRLRELAMRGMNTRKYLTEAERLERKWEVKQ